MATLASTDVTITVVKRQVLRGSPGQQNRNVVKIAFGDGSLTYPANGVPLPTKDKFGMQQTLEYLNILENASATGVSWKYDYVNKKFRGYVGAIATTTGMTELQVADTVAANIIYAEAVGW